MRSVTRVSGPARNAASTIDHPPDTYAHVAQTALEAISAYADDVRSARQIRGGIPVRPAS